MVIFVLHVKVVFDEFSNAIFWSLFLQIYFFIHFGMQFGSYILDSKWICRLDSFFKIQLKHRSFQRICWLELFVFSMFFRILVFKNWACILPSFSRWFCNILVWFIDFEIFKLVKFGRFVTLKTFSNHIVFSMFFWNFCGRHRFL